jgi:uncharacterized protein
VFGLGLAVSSMIDPAKVRCSLDLAGDWDPSLASMMASAIAVASPAFAVAKGRTINLSGGPILLPSQARLDAALVGGAVLFETCGAERMNPLHMTENENLILLPEANVAR